MAAKLRPRVMLIRRLSSKAAALLKPAAVSFSGLLDGGRVEVSLERLVFHDGTIGDVKRFAMRSPTRASTRASVLSPRR